MGRKSAILLDTWKLIQYSSALFIVNIYVACSLAAAQDSQYDLRHLIGKGSDVAVGNLKRSSDVSYSGLKVPGLSEAAPSIKLTPPMVSLKRPPQLGLNNSIIVLKPPRRMGSQRAVSLKIPSPLPKNISWAGEPANKVIQQVKADDTDAREKTKTAMKPESASKLRPVARPEPIFKPESALSGVDVKLSDAESVITTLPGQVAANTDATPTQVSDAQSSSVVRTSDRSERTNIVPEIADTSEKTDEEIRLTEIEPNKAVNQEQADVEAEPNKIIDQEPATAEVEPNKIGGEGPTLAEIEPNKIIDQELATTEVEPTKIATENLATAEAEPNKVVAENPTTTEAVEPVANKFVRSTRPEHPIPPPAVPTPPVDVAEAPVIQITKSVVAEIPETSAIQTDGAPRVVSVEAKDDIVTPRIETAESGDDINAPRLAASARIDADDKATRRETANTTEEIVPATLTEPKQAGEAIETAPVLVETVPNETVQDSALPGAPEPIVGTQKEIVAPTPVAVLEDAEPTLAETDPVAPITVPTPPDQIASLPTITSPVAMSAPDELRLRFNQGSATLGAESTTVLAGVVARMSQSKERLQVRAFARDEKGRRSASRRLSLSRALAIRSYLIDQGIDSQRIDVRALGIPTDNSYSERVDLSFIIIR